MTAIRGKDFADLVYRILISEKQRAIEDVSQDLGMKYQTFYSRINGRVPFSADEINALLRTIPDKRLADLLLHGTGFIAVEREDAKGPINLESVRSGATATLLEASDVVREVEAGLLDNVIDHRDRARIDAEIQDAERALASLREKLSRL